MEPIVSIRGLTRHFVLDGKRIDVLRGVDLDLAAGETVSLTGMSGTGKSTLLSLIGTLDEPSGGEITLCGYQTARLTRRQLATLRNESIGFVFQFHYLLPELTAEENVMMPALIARQSRQQARKRAAELLDAVGLAQRTQHKPGELSGGEQQRVAIARALVMRPRLLLADEPTGNLDERTAHEIHHMLLDLNRESGTTFVVATHSTALASLPRRHLRIADGYVEDSGAASA